MSKMNSVPRWKDMRDLIKNIPAVSDNIKLRRDIFEKISNSDTATDKEKNTAVAVIGQIDTIIVDNNEMYDELKTLINNKTKTNPNAGVKEKDQELYMSILTRVDARLNETGAFDEMLIKALNKAVTKGEENGE